MFPIVAFTILSIHHVATVQHDAVDTPHRLRHVDNSIETCEVPKIYSSRAIGQFDEKARLEDEVKSGEIRTAEARVLSSTPVDDQEIDESNFNLNKRKVGDEDYDYFEDLSATNDVRVNDDINTNVNELIHHKQKDDVKCNRKSEKQKLPTKVKQHDDVNNKYEDDECNHNADEHKKDDTDTEENYDGKDEVDDGDIDDTVEDADDDDDNDKDDDDDKYKLNIHHLSKQLFALHRYTTALLQNLVRLDENILNELPLDNYKTGDQTCNDQLAKKPQAKAEPKAPALPPGFSLVKARPTNKINFRKPKPDLKAQLPFKKVLKESQISVSDGNRKNLDNACTQTDISDKRAEQLPAQNVDNSSDCDFQSIGLQIVPFDNMPKFDNLMFKSNPPSAHMDGELEIKVNTDIMSPSLAWQKQREIFDKLLDPSIDLVPNLPDNLSPPVQLQCSLKPINPNEPTILIRRKDCKRRKQRQYNNWQNVLPPQSGVPVNQEKVDYLKGVYALHAKTMFREGDASPGIVGSINEQDGRKQSLPSAEELQRRIFGGFGCAGNNILKDWSNSSPKSQLGIRNGICTGRGPSENNILNHWNNISARKLEQPREALSSSKNDFQSKASDYLAHRQPGAGVPFNLENVHYLRGLYAMRAKTIAGNSYEALSKDPVPSSNSHPEVGSNISKPDQDSAEELQYRVSGGSCSGNGIAFLPAGNNMLNRWSDGNAPKMEHPQSRFTNGISAVGDQTVFQSPNWDSSVAPKMTQQQEALSPAEELQRRIASKDRINFSSKENPIFNYRSDSSNRNICKALGEPQTKKWQQIQQEQTLEDQEELRRRTAVVNANLGFIMANKMEIERKIKPLLYLS